MLNAKLVIVGGDSKTTEVKLKFPCIIGRGKGSTLLLPHPLVSRQHCELFEANGHLMVRDLGSLNGTYVNNEKVEEAIVPAGQLLTVGSVTFRAVYESLEDEGPNGERRTEVVYPNSTSAAAAAEDKQPSSDDFAFEANADPDADPNAGSEPAPEPEEFNFEIDVDADESEGMSSEPLFAPDPPKPTVPKIAPKAAPAAKPVAKPVAAKPAPAAKPVAAKPAAAKPVAPAAAPVKAPVPLTEEEELDDDLDDFLKSLNKS